MKRFLILLLLSGTTLAAAARINARHKRNDKSIRNEGGTSSIIRVNGREHVLFVPYPSDVNERKYEEVEDVSPPRSSKKRKPKK